MSRIRVTAAIIRVARRFDAVCGRLNAGLAAFAIALALVLALTWMGRHPEMFQNDDDASAAALGNVQPHAASTLVR